MKKRFLQFRKAIQVIMIMLLFGTVGMSKTMAQYQYGITIGELKYTLDDSTLTATVTGHKNGTNATGTLSFYSYVTYTDSFGVTRTYTVTEIGDGAFQYCRKLTGSLYIPNSVTTIGQWAFQSCSGLEYLNLGNSVTTIGVGAFKDCTGFRGNLIIPNSVVYIGNYSTYDDGAFEGCSGFTGDLNIPNSVTTIRAKSFKFCNGFTGSLTIPSSVTYIGVDAFYICDNFSGIYYTGNIAQWCGITFGNSGANPVDGVHRLYIDNTLLTHLVIPESVTSIKNYAFFDCVYLTGDLIIPNSVTTIGKAAFMYCNFTGNLTLGNSVTTIGSQAFMYCDGFTGSLTIPNSVTTIERGAFKNCSGFTGSLIIPNSVTTIGILNDYYDDGAFQGCSGFTGNLTIGNSVTIIGERSFSGCSGFTGNLTIGNSIMTIGDLAFSSCSNVESLSVFAETPPTIQSSSSFSPFYNCPKSIPVYVPCCSAFSYQSANGWSEFTNYQEMECPNYTIAVEANPSDGGIIVGAGEYVKGSTCTLTATANEGYNFINWTENGEEVSTEATYSFEVTADRNLVANFEESTIVNQLVTLNAGWNWWSTYLDITLDQLKDAIADALGTTGTATIKSSGGSINYENGRWRPASIPFDIREMYKIKVSSEIQITLSGVPVNPAEYGITIHNGYNWIGFLSSENMSVTDAFAGLNPVDGDVVKSKTGSTTYNGTSWRGSLQTLEPGKGYIYRSNATDDKPFTFGAGNNK